MRVHRENNVHSYTQHLDRLAKYGKNKDPVGQVSGVSSAVGKEFIRSHCRRGHLTRCAACHSCRQSKKLLSHPWRSRASELLAMSRPRHKLAAGLQTGHTALTAHVFNAGLTKQQDCRLCGHIKAAWTVRVCQCPAVICKRYRIWGRMFLRHKDLEKVKVKSLINLANTRLGLVP